MFFFFHLSRFCYSTNHSLFINFVSVHFWAHLAFKINNIKLFSFSIQTAPDGEKKSDQSRRVILFIGFRFCLRQQQKKKKNSPPDAQIMRGEWWNWNRIPRTFPTVYLINIPENVAKQRRIHPSRFEPPTEHFQNKVTRLKWVIIASLCCGLNEQKQKYFRASPPTQKKPKRKARGISWEIFITAKWVRRENGKRDNSKVGKEGSCNKVRGFSLSNDDRIRPAGVVFQVFLNFNGKKKGVSFKQCGGGRGNKEKCCDSITVWFGLYF